MDKPGLVRHVAPRTTYCCGPITQLDGMVDKTTARSRARNERLWTSRAANKCPNMISKRDQHDKRGFRWVGLVYRDSRPIHAYRLDAGRNLFFGPFSAAQARGVVGECIVRGSPHPTAKYVPPSRPRNPVMCITEVSTRRLNRRDTQ